MKTQKVVPIGPIVILWQGGCVYLSKVSNSPCFLIQGGGLSVTKQQQQDDTAPFYYKTEEEEEKITVKCDWGKKYVFFLLNWYI